jgi:hypothetical protein
VLATFVNLCYFHIAYSSDSPPASFISLGANKKPLLYCCTVAQLPGSTASLTHIQLPHLSEQWHHLNPYYRPTQFLRSTAFKFVRPIPILQPELTSAYCALMYTLLMPASLFSSSWPAPVVTSVLSCAILAIFSQRACLSLSFGFCPSPSRFCFRPFLCP